MMWTHVLGGVLALPFGVLGDGREQILQPRAGGPDETRGTPRDHRALPRHQAREVVDGVAGEVGGGGRRAARRSAASRASRAQACAPSGSA
ncbi:hypothetical protein C1701_17760 [Actinoalloteichus sp. AHMU CJ021]|uniref:hypothetical protein n=1 Tax=Actinoalloteichus sp. AHMU CJ021 TaxID=2072503 RepID=UPI000CA076A7|nr:hypothetical protein C1701_17760 [Actinoalloteichus sp. AHMU CJ021]